MRQARVRPELELELGLRLAPLHPESGLRSAQAHRALELRSAPVRLESELPLAQVQPEGVRCVSAAATASPFRRPQGAIPEAWFALLARLLLAVGPEAEPAWRLAAASEAPFERAARPESVRWMAAAIAWRR